MSAPPGSPPVARRQPSVRELHGRPTVDEYAWMHDDADGLRDYLAAERTYYDGATAPGAPLRRTLYDEMRARVADADESVGWRRGAFVYRSQQPAGAQYPRFVREAATGDVEVLLDLEALAAGSSYFALGVRELSPDRRLLAYSVDTAGDETYELRVRDLSTGDDLTDRIPRTCYGSVAWSSDSGTVLYVLQDAAYRPYRVMRHRLGHPAGSDTVAYEETDERFALRLTPSRSGELAVIEAMTTTTTEVRLLRTDDVHATPSVVAPRRHGVEYSVEHMPGPGGGDLYAVTNDAATEFRLLRRGIHDDADWIEVLGEDPDVRLEAATAYRGHLVVSLRRAGVPVLRVLDLATGCWREEAAGIAAGTLLLACHDDAHEPVLDDFDSASMTVVTASLVTPPQWWSIDLPSGDRTLLKTEPTPGYDATAYVTARISLPAPDGVAIPVTLAYRTDVTRDGSAPCLLYGYGAYEVSIDPWFDPAIVSLLDRGLVYAIAHVRGGGEGGRRWWLAGRLHDKRNSFTDFVAVADGLVDHGWVDGDRIACRGASAGGLLVGAALAIAPQRWRAVVAEVPFVDVVTTMLDASLPLTAGEWEEWGDPRQPADHDAIASYSPYDNVPHGPRPDLLVTGSLHDSRVLIREPAKWVARLRASQEEDDRGVVLFRAELGSAAHRGPSGRWDRLRYRAEILGFVLEALDVEPSTWRRHPEGTRGKEHP